MITRRRRSPLFGFLLLLAGSALGSERSPWPHRLPESASSAEGHAAAASSMPRAVEVAIARAAAWMATFPPAELRFDAALMLSQIARTFSNRDLDRARAAALAVARRDHDHPHQRLWNPSYVAPAKDTARWSLPRDPRQRAKPNDVISEALHCRENGLRPETVRHACGAMRDQGGFYTTHALWALVLANDNRCLTEEGARCIPVLQQELLQAQPSRLAATSTNQLDLYAERLLMLLLSGASDPSIDGFARDLLAKQSTDGSWGVAKEGEQPYFRYHATGISTWALAEWYRRASSLEVPSPSPDPP